MIAALFALFAAALGYGTLVPLVPVYLAASGGGNVAWHSGALPAAFLAAASVASPLSGHLSDRTGRRPLVVAGVAVVVLAVVPFFVEHGLGQLYAFQALAGAGFGALLPAALALLYETGDAQSRPRRVAWYGTALLGGYLVGPALGGWLAGLAESGGRFAAHEVVQLVLGIQAATAALALVMVYADARPSSAPDTRDRRIEDEPAHARKALAALLAAMLVSFLLSGFEIATVLHLRGPLGLGSGAVAALFIVCGAAMALAQLFILPAVSARASRLGWSLALVVAGAAALAAMPLARTYAGTLALAGPLGGALGLAFGLLGLEMAAVAGARRGLALGAQNAAVTAGQAAGSILGGVLFAQFAARAFALFGAAVIVAALLLTAIARRARPITKTKPRLTLP